MIGTREFRVDARGKVTGQSLYPGDITPADLLHGKVLFSGQPHARLARLDIDAALATPGVVAVFTAADVPVNEYGLIMPDQPVLVGPGSDRPGADVSRWEGDQVALVVAETEEAAALARSRIHAEWEPLPVVADVHEAMRDRVLVHPAHGSNVLGHYKIRKGDMARGWAEADVVVAGEYRLGGQEHAFLQPEAGLGFIDEEGRVAVAIGGQWTHEDQEQVAHALGLPRDRVRILYPAIGGAFGGREDMSLQIILALAAMRLHERGVNRPVRVIWSREESILGHHKRHPAFVRTRWGASRAGKITAVEAELILDAGSYAYTSTKVLGNANLMVTGPYEIPHAHVDSYAVYTNNVPGGAFRGFGGPQGAFAAENQMNKLAEALGMDPVEIRRRNVLRDDSLLTTQTPMPPVVTLAEVVDAAAAAADWFADQPTSQRANQPTSQPTNQPTSLPVNHPPYSPFQSLPASPSAVRRGRGFACSFKNVGFSFGAPEQCQATIELRGGAEIEEVILRHASAEVGQGTHTALRQMTAEAVGVPVDAVRLDMSDTASSGDSGSVSASRMTWMAGNAIRGAAEEALVAWRREDRPAVGHYQFRPPATTPYDPETGRSMPNFAYGYVAQAVEVVVDVETGHIHLERVISANDVGKAINPTLVEGQIEGAVVQAAGYALMENLQLRGGHIQNPYLSTYLIPGIMDVPDQVDSVILELADPRGPWGARGMAEMPFLPLAPAIVGALHDATGVWFDEIPLTPDRVVARLAAGALHANPA